MFTYDLAWAIPLLEGTRGLWIGSKNYSNRWAQIYFDSKYCIAIGLAISEDQFLKSQNIHYTIIDILTYVCQLQ